MLTPKGYKFISSRKQEKYAKANCMTTEAHFLETMKKLDVGANKKQMLEVWIA